MPSSTDGERKVLSRKEERQGCRTGPSLAAHPEDPGKEGCHVPAKLQIGRRAGTCPSRGGRPACGAGCSESSRLGATGARRRVSSRLWALPGRSEPYVVPGARETGPRLPDRFKGGTRRIRLRRLRRASGL